MNLFLRSMAVCKLWFPERECRLMIALSLRGLLIERDWYELGKWNLEQNSQTGLSALLGCGRSYGHEIAGLLEDELRDWCARRVPVRMGAAGLTC